MELIDIERAEEKQYLRCILTFLSHSSILRVGGCFTLLTQSCILKGSVLDSANDKWYRMMVDLI